jgi:hypothetical protein
MATQPWQRPRARPLWSFNLLSQGRRTRQQLVDAAKATEEARAQVMKALRQARSAWRQLREQSREEGVPRR